MTKIIIDPKKLKTLFPYFKDVKDDAIVNASASVGSFIATELGILNMAEETQVRGNYLACCHILYLQLNPALGQGMISSASQGSESLSYQQKPTKNWFDYQLSLTSYGLELLALLQQIQPPTIKKPINNINRYYGF